MVHVISKTMASFITKRSLDLGTRCDQPMQCECTMCIHTVPGDLCMFVVALCPPSCCLCFPNGLFSGFAIMLCACLIVRLDMCFAHVTFTYR